MLRVLALAVLLLSGCTGTVYEIDHRFAPLERIREAQVPGLGDGMAATIFTEVVTKDLSALLRANPPGSVELEALLQHERVHAVRQFADPSFFSRYATSADFRWQEEKAGWSVELAHLRAHGRTIDVEVCVRILVENYAGMVTREEARKWVLSQVGG